ncbi:hypothetical protein BH10BAC6_BH10BAC6_12930 [soil metagenome]
MSRSINCALSTGKVHVDYYYLRVLNPSLQKLLEEGSAKFMLICLLTS